MSFIVILPARFAATRLPGKPLADLGGVPMIVRAARQAQMSAASRVVVATDDERIAYATKSAGIETVITKADHPTGTDRIAEAARLLGLENNQIVVNVQGDEPFIPPELINRVAARLEERSACAMATACHPITQREDLSNPNIVKVVLNAAGDALYFSRAPIPFARDAGKSEDWRAAYDPAHPVYRHYGIYAYRAAFLQRFLSLPVAPIEVTEKLEQLRALWHGFSIAGVVASEAPAGIDTEEDLIRARAFFTASGK